MKTLFLSVFSLFLVPLVASGQDGPAERPKKPDLVLVFTKTDGFRHQSIEKGVMTLRKLGRSNNFIALRTESGEDFSAENLKNYQLVVFLNTTMNVLNDAQQKAFENYIKGGGSFLGIHAAADTEYDWPWYGKLVGGYFDGHPNNPNVRKATIEVLDKTHSSTAHLPDKWVRSDEWYNFKELNPEVTVVMNLDENSYKGGTNGDHHPIAWYHEFDGGRAYYTGGGHTDESFDEPDFKKHLMGAIEWCLKR
ncbi:ThuA domain-containing protein [Muricauda sp. SCSIO 65647]|nr:ThuA domain-containing protein [Muricauda sp. SCSIO 65647]